jgi:hypothetical protein
MEMFGVLVSTEVGHDAAGAVLRFDSTSDLTNHCDHLVEQGLVSVAEIYQGRNVLLRYDDDVNWPVRSGVLERQNLIRLGDHLDRRPTTQRLVAVEVLAHRPIPFTRGSMSWRQYGGRSPLHPAWSSRPDVDSLLGDVQGHRELFGAGLGVGHAEGDEVVDYCGPVG